MKNSKKTQQEIIVTVLLVLIAIAAVVLIATFIIKNVRQGTESGASKVDCLNLDLTIMQPYAGADSVNIQRGVGGQEINVTGLILLVDGKSVGTYNDSIGTFESVNMSVTDLTTGQVVEVAPRLMGNVLCDVKDTKTVMTA